MHAVMYAWDLGERFDGESLRRRARERGHLYERLPGLLSKAFIMDESSRRFGGFYLFARVEDADQFLASDLFAQSRSLMGEPEVRRFDVPAFVGRAAESVAAPPPRPALNHAMIYVRDVDRSLDFYQRLLGFRLIERMEGYARLEAPAGSSTIGLHLCEPDRELPRSEGIRLYLETDGLDSLCRDLSDAGVDFIQRPEDMPWGWRHAYLRDPDGHELSLYRAGEMRFRPTTPWPPRS